MEDAVPNQKFFVAGGTLALDAQSYVTREADDRLFNALRGGSFCYVLNSRQMGKSSISIRTVARLNEIGSKTCFIDLTKIGGKNVTADQWYAGLTGEVGRSVGVRTEMLLYWKEHSQFGAMQRFFGALREVVLERCADPIVIFLDEIDATLSLSFSADEFFAGIRECFNRRAQDPAYKRLTFCLLGVALPSDLISDPRTTPFNIGERIVLKDFTLAEASALAAGMGPNGKNLLERAYHWTNGHPFLTQTLCAIAAAENVQRPDEIDAIVQQNFVSAKAKEANINLADVGNRILNSYPNADEIETYRSDILSLYGNILKSKPPVVDDEANRLIGVLKLSGVLRTEGNTLRVRNRIYEGVFNEAWIKEHMPFAEVRRQKAAYWQGVGRTAVAGLALVAIVGSMASIAYREANVAIAAEQKARLANQTAQRKAEEAIAATIKASKEAAAARKATQRAKEAESKAEKALGQEKASKTQIAKLNEDLKQALSEANSQKTAAILAKDKSSRVARENASLASSKAQEAEHNRELLYVADMAWAARDLAEGNGPHMLDLLLKYLPKKGQPDIRGFEWRYLWHELFHRGTRLATLSSEPLDVAVTPSGKAAYIDSKGVLWVQNGATFAQYGSPTNVRSASFSNDARQAIIVGVKEVFVYDTERGVRVNGRGTAASIGSIAASKPRYPIRSRSGEMSYQPSGNFMARTGDADVLIPRAVLNSIPPVEKESALATAFSPDGARVVKSDPRQIRYFEIPDAITVLIKPSLVIPTTTQITVLRCGGPDQDYPIIGANAKGVYLWKQEPANYATFSSKHQTARQLVATKDYIYAGDSQYCMRLNKQNLVADEPFKGKYFDWCVSPDGKFAALLRDQKTGKVELLTLSSGSSTVLTLSGGRTSKIAFASNKVLELQGKGQPQYFNIATQQLTQGNGTSLLAPNILASLVQPSSPVKYCPDGKSFATGTRDGKLTLWNTSTGLETFSILNFEGPVRAFDFVPDGTMMVTGFNPKRCWFKGSDDAEVATDLRDLGMDYATLMTSQSKARPRR